MTGTPTSDPDRSGGVGTVDSSHLAMRAGARGPELRNILETQRRDPCLTQQILRTS
jgi:hypothetical protein